MTTKEFHDLKIGDHILKGKRKAEVTGLGPSYVEFRFMDTKRPSARGYRGLKSIKVDTNSRLVMTSTGYRKEKA